MSEASSLREHFADGFRVGEWFVEPMLNRVRREDETIQLEPKVMEVLLCMARRPGKTVTKERFKKKVWTETIVTDDVLSRCISQLRKVFDDDPKDPSYIETIRKTGYRLVAPIEHEEAPPSASDDQALAAPRDEAAERGPLQRLRRALSGRLQDVTPRLEDPRKVVGGMGLPRKWLLAVGGLLGALFVFVLLFWATSSPMAGEDDPISAVPLTSFSGEEFDPSLSSLGHQVAFAWRQPDSLHQNIYLMQRGAQQPLRLSDDSSVDWSPTWSPNGRFVAYVQEFGGAHHVSIVPSIGGQDRQALRLEHRDIQGIAWIPDTTGRSLVISAERRPHQAYGLSLLHLDTDSITTLTTPPLWSIGDQSPTLSPDGSQIAFVRGTVRGVENVFVMPASGGAPTQVTTDSTDVDGLAWSADGSEIVYAAQRSGVSGLWRVEADGGDPTLIRSATEGTRFSHPTLAPRSNRLAYTLKSAQLDVWTLRQPSQYAEFEATPLLSSTQEDASPSIAPNGKRIAFVSDRSGTPEIWIAQADGTKPNRLTSLGGPTIHAVSWSPDGTSLCFVARRHGQSDLYLLSASGGASSRLTTAHSEDMVPRWSRDGQRIYFTSNRTGHWEVWRTRVAADSHRVQRVTAGGAVAAQESVTDSTLYLVRPDTTGIWTAPLDSTRFPLPIGTRDTLSTQTDTTGASDGPTEREARLGSEDRERPLRQVIDDFNPRERGNWWVGENGIHFIHRQSNRAVLAYYDFASNRILPLYEFPDWRPVQSLAVGPGGEWFAYTHVVRRESDVMLVEQFQ